MGFVSSMSARREPQNAVDFSPELREALFNGDGGSRSSAGPVITWQKALQVTAIYRGTCLLADGLAIPPWKLYRRNANGDRIEARDHYLWDIIHSRPNPWQTSAEFRETIGIHLALCQNAYVFVNKVRDRIIELIPLEPNKVSVEQKDDWTLEYTTTFPDGSVHVFPPGTIWHIRRRAWNSYQGLEAIKLARDAIGLALSIEEGQSRMHRDGVRPSGVLSVEGAMEPEQFKQWRKLVEYQYAGRSNAGKAMILDRSAKWEQLQMTNLDAQTQEARNFQIEEAARAIGVLPVMLGHTGDKGSDSYASVEQKQIHHIRYSIMPMHTVVGQSADVWLLTEKERRQGFYFGFVLGDMLNGDHKTMAEFYSVALGGGRQPGWLTVNDVRGFFELPKKPGMDRLFMPINTAPIGDDGLPILPANTSSVSVDNVDENGKPTSRVTLHMDRENIGRTLSSKNEKLIRGAADLIDQADGNLTDVLASLDKPEETEE